MGTMGNTFGPGNGPGEFIRETADFTGEDESAAEVSGRGNDFRTEEFPEGSVCRILRQTYILWIRLFIHILYISMHKRYLQEGRNRIVTGPAPYPGTDLP